MPDIDIDFDYRRRGEVIDYGFVGDIVSINRGVLMTQLDNGLVPVVSSLAADGDGTLLNINADTIAAAIAAAIGAPAPAARPPVWPSLII